MPLNFTLKVTAAIIMIQKETLSIIYEPKSKQLVEIILQCENHVIEKSKVVSISDCNGNSLKYPYSFPESDY